MALSSAHFLIDESAQHAEALHDELIDTQEALAYAYTLAQTTHRLVDDLLDEPDTNTEHLVETTHEAWEAMESRVSHADQLKSYMSQMRDLEALEAADGEERLEGRHQDHADREQARTENRRHLDEIESAVVEINEEVSNLAQQIDELKALESSIVEILGEDTAVAEILQHLATTHENIEENANSIVLHIEQIRHGTRHEESEPDWQED